MMQIAVALSAFSLFSFLVFTPEPLVLLRDIIFVAALTGATSYGYSCWEASSIRDVVFVFRDGGMHAVAGMLWTNFWNACIIGATRFGAASRQKASAWLLHPFGILFSWLGGYKSSSSASMGIPNDSPSPHIRQRYCAILVTTPPVHEYGVISDSVCAPIDRPEKIPWNRKTTEAIPSMSALLLFRRHFALCLMPEANWESKDKTLEEKFIGQLFWDYSGEGRLNSEATKWAADRVRTINAIQKLGPVILDKEVINTCSRLCRQLKSNWDYINIWWNSADFALTLAYLLADESGAFTCRQLMSQLTKLRVIQVTEPRGRAWGTSGMIGMASFVAAWTVTAATAGASLPITGPMMAGGWGLGFTSGAAAAITQSAERSRWERRLEACREVERRFSQVAPLYSD